MNDLRIPIIGIERLRMATDGNGIRTLIGTYGCPLRCRYCLNPQSWDRSLKPALYTPEQLFKKVSIDSIYFQATNGGLTIGGGEPLLYMPAIQSFAALCPDTWSLWTETALNVDQKHVESASKVFHHFIVDIKTLDAEIYKEYTGKELRPALDNLLYLQSVIGSDRITVRVPLIPGFVDIAAQEKSTKELVSLGFTDIDTFTYRTDIKK